MFYPLSLPPHSYIAEDLLAKILEMKRFLLRLILPPNASQRVLHSNSALLSIKLFNRRNTFRINPRASFPWTRYYSIRARALFSNVSSITASATKPATNAGGTAVSAGNNIWV